MNPKKKIKAAKINLMKEQPFFSYLVVKLTAKEDKKSPTMGVDLKGNLHYNPEFVKKLSRDKLMGVMCHEILHLGLEHELRRNNRNHKTWNVAADYAINLIVKRNGLKLPNKVLYNKKFKGKPAEIIYEDIRGDVENKNSGNKNKKKEKSNSESSGNSGDGDLQKREGYVKVGDDEGNQFDNHPKGAQKSDMNKDEVKKKAQKWKDEMAAAAEYSKQRGDTPAGMDRVLDELFEQKLNWKQILRKYITRSIPVDYTYSKPRKSYYTNNIYLPKVKKEGTDIVVAVDTSGSIGEKELAKFGSEINGILQSHQGVSMELLIGDAKLQNHKKIDRFTKNWYKDISWAGRGGTQHEWIFKWVKENSPRAKLIVSFTDGYTSFPDKSQIHTDTLWISTGLKPEEYPFGKAVRFKLDA